MKLFLYLTAVGSILLAASATFSQEKSSGIDNYLATAKTIVVAKCLAVGPLNILLKAHVDIEILHVVKGKETPRRITIVSQFGMAEGQFYVLKTKSEATKDGIYFAVDTIDSVIPISSESEIAVLKTLSPRIVVLRTMNMRIYRLENKIRHDTYELEALKAAREEN